MSTVLDVIKYREVEEYVYTDIRKLDGTALHVWKQKNEKFLIKIPQEHDDKILQLIDFPKSFLKTLNSIVGYHFEKKKNGGKVKYKAMLEEKKKVKRATRFRSEEDLLIKKANQQNFNAQSKYLSPEIRIESKSRYDSNSSDPNKKKRKRIIRKKVKR